MTEQSAGELLRECRKHLGKIMCSEEYLDLKTRIDAHLSQASEPEWKCAARGSNMGAGDPQECDWPGCGCDPYADKVIAALGEAGKLNTGWLPIKTAPQTGEHILVAQRDNSVGFGLCGGKQQFFADVAHWFFDGFYPSHYGSEPERQLENLTHWKPL